VPSIKREENVRPEIINGSFSSILKLDIRFLKVYEV